MKKFVLCLVMVLLFAQMSFAAAFDSVPKGHWAYDAVRQLAARGIVSDSFVEAEFSRFEMAGIILKALSKTEELYGSKEDIQLLKRLYAEFHTELETIGVKTDRLAASVSKIENGIGAWNLSGSFVFDAVHSAKGGWSNKDTKAEWRKEQMYLYLTKRINENTTFYSEFRMGADGAGSEKSQAGLGDISEHMLTHFYVNTVLPWGIDARIGRFGIDFEEEYGMYTDNDAVFGHFRLDGFQLQKQFGALRVTAAVGKNRATDDDTAEGRELDSFRTHSILDLKYEPNEKLMAGMTGYRFIGSNAPEGFKEINGNTAESTGANDWDIQAYSGYFTWRFADGAKLKGVYYRQLLGKTVAGNYRDNPQSWKLILDLDQELLKAGSLWLEYNAHDNSFWNSFPDRYAISGSAHCSVGDNMPENSETSKFFFARFERSWNKRFNTGIRYAYGDYGTEGYAPSYELGVYASYKLNSAVSFELYLDHFDYGESSVASKEVKRGTDNVIQLRTTVKF